MNIEHNKEQNQCSYDFTESHKQRNVGINRNINKKKKKKKKKTEAQH